MEGVAMSRTLQQRIDAGDIKPGDVTHPERGMTFYLDGYGEFQFQFPAPVWCECEADDQDDGIHRGVRNAILEDIIGFGKFAEGIKGLNHVNLGNVIDILVDLYRRLDAYLQLIVWSMSGGDDYLFETLSRTLSNDAPDINEPSHPDLGALLKMLGGDR